MAFIVRGVEMFSGLAGEEWGEDVPLRRVESLCGLRLGGPVDDGTQDAPEDWAMGLDLFGEVFEQRPRLRLVAAFGQAFDADHRVVDRVSDAQHIGKQGRAGR